MFRYKLAPVSKNVFTMAKVTTDATGKEIQDTKAQEINLATLNEAGLHKALYILKFKVNPADLGTAEEAWKRLPTSKKITLDEDLRKAYPENMLRLLLQQFMEIWTLETLDKRNLVQIDKKQFENVPGWPALHSVKPQYAGDSQLVMTQHGVQIQPEECANKLRELRSKINQLATDLASCTDPACNELQALNVREKQSKCVTAV